MSTRVGGYSPPPFKIKKGCHLAALFWCVRFTLSEKLSSFSDFERGGRLCFGDPVHQFHTQSPCVEEIVWLRHPVEQFL